MSGAAPVDSPQMDASDYIPQLATLVKSPPSGDEWLHEIKLDGYRIGCLVSGDRVRLISRNGLDFTRTFPAIADAARTLRASDALIDGELVVLTPEGRSSFELLQQTASGRRVRGALVYYAFDLLRLDGKGIDRLPLEERKKRLKALVGTSRKARIRYTDHVIGHGPAMFAEACRLGLEGIVSKRRDLPYSAGRRDSWRKTKCVKRDVFVIGGFTDPAGARSGLGALLVGQRVGRRLVFAGRVGTGFSQALARDLRHQLEALAQSACPFDPPPTGPLARGAHWVAPALRCEVTFTEWTEAGLLRHPSFQRLEP